MLAVPAGGARPHGGGRTGRSTSGGGRRAGPGRSAPAAGVATGLRPDPRSGARSVVSVGRIAPVGRLGPGAIRWVSPASLQVGRAALRAVSPRSSRPARAFGPNDPWCHAACGRRRPNRTSGASGSGLGRCTMWIARDRTPGSARATQTRSLAPRTIGPAEKARVQLRATEARRILSEGQLLVEISNGVVQEFWASVGKGPSRCKAYWAGRDLLVVLLRGGFTVPEQTLFDAGPQTGGARLATRPAGCDGGPPDEDHRGPVPAVASSPSSSASRQSPDLRAELFLLEPSEPDSPLLDDPTPRAGDGPGEPADACRPRGSVGPLAKRSALRLRRAGRG